VQAPSEYGRIARVVARVIRDRSRAEDLAVEAFWKLWKTPGAREYAAGWLRRTAIPGATRNSCDDEYPSTPLAWATRRGHKQIVDMLRASGAR
jgi:hypothetical protein